MVCQAGDRLRGGTTADCRDCAATARLVRGRCAGCRLRARIAGVFEGADPSAAVALGPFLRRLAAAANPASTLRWMQTPAFGVTRDLLAGAVEVSHAGLDSVEGDAPQAVGCCAPP